MSIAGKAGQMLLQQAGPALTDYVQRGADKILGIDRKKEQIEQQKKLNELQIAGNKELANHAQKLQQQMWDYTNYENQRQHIENAGLNPAMLYGSGGGGAALGTPATGTVGGAAASDEASMLSARNQAFGLGLQVRMNEAQVKLAEAQATKATAEAEKTAGVDTAETQSRINEINANIEVLKADEALKNSQNELNELQQISLKIANEFNEKNNIELLKQSTATTKKLIAEAQISEQSINTIVETLKANLKNVIVDATYKQSNIKLNEANIQNILNNITVQNKKLEIDTEKIKNDWNIAILNNKSGYIMKDARGFVDNIIELWTGKNLNKDTKYKE